MKRALERCVCLKYKFPISMFSVLVLGMLGEMYFGYEKISGVLLVLLWAWPGVSFLEAQGE